MCHILPEWGGGKYGTPGNLVNVIICFFVDHTLGSYWYRYGGNSKGSLFLYVYFQVFWIYFSYSSCWYFIIWLILIRISFMKFAFVALNYYIWFIGFYEMRRGRDYIQIFTTILTFEPFPLSILSLLPSFIHSSLLIWWENGQDYAVY